MYTAEERRDRLAEMLQTVGHLWGDDVCYMLAVRLDSGARPT